MRHLLPFGLLLLVPIFLAQAGSAARPPVTNFEICVQNATGGTASPDCSGAKTTSTFTGAAPATVQLSVINDKSSTVQITAATITVPPQLRVIAGTAAPTKYVSSSGQVISFTGLNLPGGKSFTATFEVNAACGGTADWNMQPQSASGSGNTFEYRDVPSQGVPSSITTACHLGFVHQPTDTQTTVDPQATDPGLIHDIRDGGASNGNPVTIGIFNESGEQIGCPTGWDSCSVTVGKAQTAGTLSGTLTQQLSGSPLEAAFDDLTISIGDDLADQFNLTATAVDAFAPTATSSSFLVAQSVTPLPCSGNSCASNGHQQVSGTNLADSFVDVTSSNGFTFMTLSPFTLVGATPHAGCQGLQPLNVTGFAESDSRLQGSGTITIRYYVNKDILSARYGKNVGNQFAPMCVGARPVDTTTGVIHDCNDQGTWNMGPWVGDAITSGGKFTGKSAPAVCDTDGYYWGIISSYQDKLDPSANPTVTNWGGTQIEGANYRFFDMSIPPGWDYRGGP
jgi:hypothetical protein